LDKPVSPYKEQFPVGSRVRVKPSRFLHEFRKAWKYHHPISDEQLNPATVTDTVKGVAFYHGATFFTRCPRLPGYGTKCVWNRQPNGGSSSQLAKYPDNAH
jgi:hypothetical protein